MYKVGDRDCPFGFVLDQRIWHVTLKVSKLTVTIILNITQKVLRGALENPLSSSHSPSYLQSGAVTQFLLDNNGNFPG